MKDERPYLIQEAEKSVLTDTAKKVFEELKNKDKVAVYPDDLKKIIFDQIEERIKEIKKAKKEGGGDMYFEFRTNWNLNKSVEDLMKKAKEEFEEIYFFGRVKKFFMPKTGLGVIPDRDQNGNLMYVFYDTKWTFVKRQG